MTPRYYDSLPSKRQSSLNMLSFQFTKVTKSIYVYNFFDLEQKPDISIDEYLAKLKVIFHNQQITKVNLDGWQELRDIFTKSPDQNVATEHLKVVLDKILSLPVKIDPKKLFELKDDYRDFFLHHLIEAYQRVGKIQLANALRLRQQKIIPAPIQAQVPQPSPARISPSLLAELQKTIALQSGQSRRTPAQPQFQTTTTTLLNKLTSCAEVAQRKRKLDASISTETIPDSADLSLERPAKRVHSDANTAVVGAEPSFAYPAGTAEIAEVVSVITPPDSSPHLDTDWVNQYQGSPMGDEEMFQFTEEDFQLSSSFKI